MTDFRHRMFAKMYDSKDNMFSRSFLLDFTYLPDAP
jgi:hypothetical protein